MAKKITAKNTKKETSFSVIINGKKIAGSTTCKKNWKQVKNSKNELAGNCKKCSEKNGNDFIVCQFKNPAKKVVISKVERDQYGFTLSGNHSKLVVLLTKNPLKMADVKKELGNTYYECVNKYPKIFGKTKSTKLFYVKKAASEKSAIKREGEFVAKKAASDKKAVEIAKAKKAAKTNKKAA